MIVLSVESMLVYPSGCVMVSIHVLSMTFLGQAHMAPGRGRAMESSDSRIFFLFYYYFVRTVTI